MTSDMTTAYDPESNNENSVGYIALTPVDCADEKDNYFRALKFAIDNEQICNIAITGPYGSGKTSIIKSFEKNNQYKFLSISLASFKEEPENQIPDNLIERSILQQMLYGADASKLPYSRFKRITVPDKSLIKSALFALWALAIGYIYLNGAAFLNLNIFNNLHIIQVLIISYALALPIVLISDIHKSSFGISFKKLSLKNAEIEATDTPENSILNRHLDEIIYFFKEVNYEVVVIEDLDRFGSPEIFVKLREINKLINDNRQPGKKIKFLYALRDDMFVHNNRVKFFDFIIPVIPIVNSSNSSEMMRKRLKDIHYANDISDHFISEVALYIDDMRLIHNIFNEFVLYKSELHSDRLNTTKLLAMMIYKNVYPDDFEKLHHAEGALFKIGNMRAALITSNKRKIYDEIASLKKDIALSGKEETKNEIELIRLFIGHLVSTVEQPINGLNINNQPTYFNQINDWDVFAQLFNTTNIVAFHHTPNYGNRNVNIGKSFSQLQTEISPNQTFAQRKKNIENKAAAKRIEIQAMIHALEKEITTISQLPLHELILRNNQSIEEILTNNGISNLQPLAYLIKNGYLDESHYLYTSQFYEGRLTKNDHDFLITIRDFKKPDPRQPIDTPNEVCSSMRPEDFAHNYVLNVTLFDYLLTDNANRERLRLAVSYISANFREAEEFFTAYWDIGRDVIGFVKAIAEIWPSYGAAAVNSPQAPEHFARMLQHVDAKHVVEMMNSESVLTNYLSKNGYLVYASDIMPPKNYAVLKGLKTLFSSLASLASNKDLLDFAHLESLYEINPENIGLLLDTYRANKEATFLDHATANYSAISAYGSPELKGYIDTNLSLYLEKVFFSLPDNTKENAEIIKQLLNSEQVNDEQKIKIISKQEVRFETFAGIPDDLWGEILYGEKVIITWENIACYLHFERVEKDIVTHLLNRTSVIDVLSKQKIDFVETEKETFLLTEFVFGNDAIDDAAYCKLVPCLTYMYTDFPESISTEKMKCLISEKAVKLSVSTFEFLKDGELLLTMLLGYNINEYISNKQNYPISDDVRAKLLQYEMSSKQTNEICLDATPEGVIANKAFAGQIAELLKLPDTDISPFDNRIIASAIANARQTDTSIQVLTKCIPEWDRVMIMETLEQLPSPYNEITEYGKSPKIPDTPINRQFATLLVEHGIVSSISDKNDSIRINTFKSPD